MSKETYLARYFVIVHKLQSQRYCSFEELMEHTERRLDNMHLLDKSMEQGLSLRTFQRDKNEIRRILGIEIEYSKSEKAYFISHSETGNMNIRRMLEAYDIFHSLKLAQGLSKYIHLEKRKPQGTEHLYLLLHAIKEKRLIKFNYEKWEEEEITKRSTEPYALKEFRNRWYLLARDRKDGMVKSFGLDRLSEPELTTEKFSVTEEYDVEETYRYCFGIVGPTGEKPEEIILSFNPFQGKYIQALPLHETQEVILNNKKEFRIKLTLFVTHDFVMELLSFGKNVKIVQPKSLAEEVKERKG